MVSTSPRICPILPMRMEPSRDAAIRFGNDDEDWVPEEDPAAEQNTLLRVQRLRGVMEQLAASLQDLVRSPHLYTALGKLGGPTLLEKAMLTATAEEMDKESGGQTQFAQDLPHVIAASYLNGEVIEEAHFRQEQEDNPFYRELFGPESETGWQ